MTDTELLQALVREQRRTNELLEALVRQNQPPLPTEYPPTGPNARLHALARRGEKEAAIAEAKRISRAWTEEHRKRGRA